MTNPDRPPRPAVSRRVVLAAAATAVAAGALAVARPGTAAHDLIPRPRTPVDPAALGPGPDSERSAPRVSRPVYTLADYRRMVPGPAFPSHAVALTIDDGPHPVWTPKILALLDRHHVPATFFLIGNQVRGHENVARSVAAAGHHIANHTYSHPTSLAHLTPAQIRSELGRAQTKIAATTGVTPRLFRPPGGAWSRPVLQEAFLAGLVPIDWNADPVDWRRPGTASITAKLLAAGPGSILLCHDGGGDRSQTYAALTTVIPALVARGYAFVAL